MKQLTIFLANWGVGTLLIGIFALVCIALTIIVLNFVMGGKKNDREEKSNTVQEKENRSE